MGCFKKIKGLRRSMWGCRDMCDVGLRSFHRLEATLIVM